MPVLHIPNEAYHLLQTAKKEGHHGENIHSSLSMPVQKRVNTLVESHVRKLNRNLIFNAAAIVVEVESGKVVAYKGNVPAGKDHGEFVDIIRSQRSPGSLLKPFLYAAALDEGIIYPQQLIPDIPMVYKGFAPKNFDKKFRGAVPADDALAGSLNVPFVFLLRDYGYEKLHWKLREIGMKSLINPARHYGLSLILGGAETSLWEITSLYAGMVRSYETFNKRPIGKGYSSDDFREHQYLLTDTIDPKLSPSGAFTNASISYTLGALQKLQRPEEESGWERFANATSIAWKTGTSYGFKDAWAIGCSNEYVVGVWVGNADGEGRPGLVGVKAAAPLMFRIFDLLPGESDFNRRFGETVDVCKKSGMKAGKGCSEKTEISLPVELHDSRVCDYHKVLNLNSNGPSRDSIQKIISIVREKPQLEVLL
jgi:penicillin-binding protein 1C